ncbi:MAG: beta strand repeat-containing protein [Terriglobia bacterium]
MQKRGTHPEAEGRICSNFHAVLHLHAMSCHWHRWRLLLRALVAAGIVSTLVACGGGGGASVDPPARSASSQVSELTISPASIAFGSVKTGTTSTQTITLDNAGAGSVTVSQANVTGNGFSVSGLSLPLTLAAGQSSSFSAAFSSTATGSVSGSISVVSGASNSPVTVPLSATGVTTQAAVTPASVNFGNVEVGARSTATLTMSNAGTSPVTVSQVSATGNGFSVNGPSLPVTLTGGQAARFAVAFSPVTAAAATGGISIVSDASSSPVTIPLSGTGATMQVALSPSSLNFGSVTVGASSAQGVILSNAGTAPVTVSQATVTGAGFSLSGLPLPLSLAAGQSVTLQVNFTPTTAGNAAGSISIVSSAANSPTVLPLAGAGGTFQLTATPTSISFGNVKVGASGTQTVTLTNTGNSPVTVSQASASGTGFSLSSLTLPVTLTAGQSTSFSANFSPTAAANETGSISIVSNAANSPLSIPLSGSGVTLEIAVSPTSLNFGAVNVGGSSAQTVALSNTGTLPVTVSQATALGTGFSMSGLALPMTLAAGQSLNFSATFSPKAAGSVSGSISVVSNASNSPLTLSLLGAGSTQVLSVSPSSLSFGNITIGSNSILPVVVTNAGSASVIISQATATGAGFSVTGPSLPLTLAAGQNTSFTITFDPISGGSITGNLSVVSNATNSPTATSLSATGLNKHSVALTWTASTSPSITGYNVYCGTVSGGPYAKLNPSLVTSTAYTDTTVQAGLTYYYVTTAVDSQGVESADSNQATAVVPFP